MKNLLQGVAHLLFPDSCAVCRRQLYTREEVLCTGCLKTLPRTGFDFRIGNPVEKIFWGRIPITSASSFLTFAKQGVVQSLLFKLKYKGETDIGVFLGRQYGMQILKTLGPQPFDGIVPVPLHPRKMKKRGYNQCELVCEGISEVLEIPLMKDALIRKIHNPTQTRKNRSDRWENVEDIFEAGDSALIRYKHLLLVDDVVTTGSTLEAAATPLMRIDGVRISIVTIAFPE